MTKVAKLRALLIERPDGFALITGIIDTEQIDFLSRESILHESSTPMFDFKRKNEQGRPTGHPAQIWTFLVFQKCCAARVFRLQTGLQIKHFAADNTSISLVDHDSLLQHLLTILLLGVSTLV